MTIIPHPDRPDEYLHAGEIIIENRDDPRMLCIIDTRWTVNEKLSQRKVSSKPIVFDKDDERHMTAYAVLKELALESVKSVQDEIQSARDARMTTHPIT